MSHVGTMSAVFLVCLAGIPSRVAAGGEDLPFGIRTLRDDDKVEVHVEKGKVRFSIRSRFGISQAVVERNGKDWPAVVDLRLHLRGLEHFKISNGKVTLKGAVSSHGDDHPVRLWLDDREDSPLNDQSPFWTEVRMMDKDGKPAKRIPLDAGYFEMRLPKKLFEENPKTITVSWIDFYR